MRKLIDTDSAINEISRFDGYLDDDMILRLQIALNRLPTIDAIPVVHGHWRRGKLYPHNIYCSNCFRTYVPSEEIEIWKDDTRLPRKYCPECGAKMDEVTE